MYVCDNSDTINMENKAHSLMLSGAYLGNVEVNIILRRGGINNLIDIAARTYWIPAR